MCFAMNMFSSFINARGSNIESACSQCVCVCVCVCVWVCVREREGEGDKEVGEPVTVFTHSSLLLLL